jgi:S-DNA-T family DNA segregation ATPase FtsK/SpoIIIE
MGDMLYMTPGASHLSRVHGAFVSDDEIENVVGFLREHSQTNYLNSVVLTSMLSSAFMRISRFAMRIYNAIKIIGL